MRGSTFDGKYAHSTGLNCILMVLEYPVYGYGCSTCSERSSQSTQAIEGCKEI